MYGTRRDPARTLSSVTTTLEHFSSDELSAALASLADSLRLPGVAITVDGRRTGRIPDGGGEPTVLELRFRSEPAGHLEVWPRRGQSSLNSDDLATLQLVAGPLGAAVHALKVNEQLQDSRRQLVTAREEEQQRLHHDLHDGLGPTLTAIALKADAARRDQGQSEALLTQISAEARDAIADVRRIAHDLRAPTLESLGLMGALRRYAEQLSVAVSLSVTIEGRDARGGLPALPAAVENAAYQVAREALTNAVRHSGASRILVRVSVTGDMLELQVADNGSQGDGAWVPGFGLSGMRQRAARLGGSLHAAPTPEGGLVTVHLPLGGLPTSSELPAPAERGTETVDRVT